MLGFGLLTRERVLVRQVGLLQVGENVGRELLRLVDVVPGRGGIGDRGDLELPGDGRAGIRDEDRDDRVAGACPG